MIGYSIVTITAPILGVLSGGKIIDYLVNYYFKHLYIYTKRAVTKEKINMLQ